MNPKKNKQFVTPLSERELRVEAERLIKTGRMPTLTALCAAVLEARGKYANQIRRARREAREVLVSTKLN